MVQRDELISTVYQIYFYLIFIENISISLHVWFFFFIHIYTRYSVLDRQIIHIDTWISSNSEKRPKMKRNDYIFKQKSVIHEILYLLNYHQWCIKKKFNVLLYWAGEALDCYRRSKINEKGTKTKLFGDNFFIFFFSQNRNFFCTTSDRR